MLSLNSFAELARDGSRSGRKTLVTALTDLFVSSRMEEAEHVSVMFGDIVMRVLGELEEETRMALANRMKAHPAAPAGLIAKLAGDKIAIARPVLEDSPVLATNDLVDLAKTKSMDHLDAIAHRDQLDEAVTDILVDRGDPDVLAQVASNGGASMASVTFRRLVEKARNNPQLQEALVGRQDLPEEVSAELVGMVSEELRDRLKSLGGSQALANSMAGRAMEEVKARAGHLSQDMEQVKKLIEGVKGGQVPLEEAIIQLAKADKAAELSFLLATVNNLPPTSVSNLIYAKSDKPLVILCKANGVNADAYKYILTMRARRLGLSGAQVTEALVRYRDFSPKTAKESLLGIRQASAGHEETPEQVKASSDDYFRRRR